MFEAENAVMTAMLGPHRDTCDGDESKVDVVQAAYQISLRQARQAR